VAFLPSQSPLPSYKMRFQAYSIALFSAVSTLGVVVKRDGAQFRDGQPIDGKGKGAPILGTPKVPIACCSSN